MTPQEYRNQYKAPKGGFGEYAISNKDWPSVQGWMAANKLQWVAATEPAALFGQNLDRVTCLVLTNGDKLSHIGPHSALEKLEKSLGAIVQMGPRTIMLHPSILRPAAPPVELDF
jgi:hypothetical protein